MKSEKVIIFILGAVAALLLIGLFNLPAWAKWILNLAAAIAFGYCTYRSFREKIWARTVLFFILTLLFQPFFNIPVGELIWKIIVIAVAIYLIALLVRTITKKKNQQ